MRRGAALSLSLALLGCDGFDPDDIQVAISQAEVSQSSDRPDDEAAISLTVSVVTGEYVAPGELLTGGGTLSITSIFGADLYLTMQTLVEPGRSTFPLEPNMNTEFLLTGIAVRNDMLRSFCGKAAQLETRVIHLPPGDETSIQFLATRPIPEVECENTL